MNRRVYYEINRRDDTRYVLVESYEDDESTDSEDAYEDVFCCDFDVDALSSVDIDLDEIDDFLNEDEDVQMET
jgi:hypothetical protein